MSVRLICRAPPPWSSRAISDERSGRRRRRLVSPALAMAARETPRKGRAHQPSTIGCREPVVLGTYRRPVPQLSAMHRRTSGRQAPLGHESRQGSLAFPLSKARVVLVDRPLLITHTAHALGI